MKGRIVTINKKEQKYMGISSIGPVKINEKTIEFMERKNKKEGKTDVSFGINDGHTHWFIDGFVSNRNIG